MSVWRMKICFLKPRVRRVNCEAGNNERNFARGKARKGKAPTFCGRSKHALALALEELGELAKAVNDNKPWDEVCAEAYDTIAVLVRIVEEK